MKNALWFPVLFVLAACGSLQNLDYYRVRSASKIMSTGFEETIRFKEDRPLIIIPVQIKGETYDFIFDTGASTTVVSRELAGKLSLEKKADVNAGDSKGNKKNLSVALVDTMTIAGVHFGDIAAAIVDWPEYSVIECLAPAGIIGNNLIRHCNWVVDYKEYTMYLSDGNLQREGMHYVPMKYPNGRPYLQVQADSLEISECLLDLGSSGNLDVSTSIVKSKGWNWQKYPHVYEIDGSSQGLYGSKMDTTIHVKVDSLRIGSYVLYNPLVEIEKPSGSKIGTRILEQSIVHLDYSGERVGFLPYDSIAHYQHKGKAGVTIMMDTAGFYISSIQRNGEAWEKGLRYGQRVHSLNGMQYPDFDGLCDYMDYLFSMENKVDTVQIILEDNLREINLTKTKSWLND